jgi:D-alanine-D-alanine ligase
MAGGCSPEREISLRSGKACFEAVKRLGYDALWVDIKGSEALYALKEQSVDLALLLTHGEGGEDGRLQGALDWLGVPYTGSSAPVSSLCMDKVQTQGLLTMAGLPCAPFLCPSAPQSYGDAVEKLGSEALFAKPRWGGSSIGSGPVFNEQDWVQKVACDGGMIVETQLRGREITVGLLAEGDGFLVLPILELVSKNEFYDFEAKYSEGMTEFVLPAPMSAEERERVERLALKTAQLVGLGGYGRVDMVLTTDGPRILEVNTLPGMTSTSDLPAMAASVGIAFDDLVLRLINTAKSQFSLVTKNPGS